MVHVIGDHRTTWHHWRKNKWRTIMKSWEKKSAVPVRQQRRNK